MLLHFDWLIITTASQVCIILAVAFLCMLRRQKKGRSHHFCSQRYPLFLLTIFKAGSGALPASPPQLEKIRTDEYKKNLA